MLSFFRKPLLSEIFEAQYLPRKLRTKSPHTIKGYRITLRFFERYLSRPARLSDLSDDTLSSYAVWRRQNVKGGTVNRDLHNLLAFWRWCHRQKLVANWPDVELENVPVEAPIALTRTEINAVWKSILNESECVGEATGPVWWGALFLLCWDTGERIGALAPLQRRDVSTSQGWIRCRAANRKGGKEDRIYRIDQQTCQAIDVLLRCYTHNKDSYRVFRWPQSKSKLWKRLGQIMLRAGLPDDRNYKFHCFRKSHVSHLEAAGVDASQAVGHSSRKITKRHYIDPRIAGIAPAVDSLFRPGE